MKQFPCLNVCRRREEGEGRGRGKREEGGGRRGGMHAWPITTVASMGEGE
jgi:hypothetical protein